jgi:hypothetical protein
VLFCQCLLVCLPGASGLCLLWFGGCGWGCWVWLRCWARPRLGLVVLLGCFLCWFGFVDCPALCGLVFFGVVLGGWFIEAFDGEFDPGSGRTLAACLTHASRAERPLSGGTRAANG